LHSILFGERARKNACLKQWVWSQNKLSELNPKALGASENSFQTRFVSAASATAAAASLFHYEGKLKNEREQMHKWIYTNNNKRH
jgi:hypothetical protein